MKKRTRPSLDEIEAEVLQLALAAIKESGSIDDDQSCLVMYETPSARELKYHETAPSLDQLTTRQTLLAREAEHWLGQGDPSRARIEWDKMSSASHRHPLVIKLGLRIDRAARATEKRDPQA